MTRAAADAAVRITGERVSGRVHAINAMLIEVLTGGNGTPA